MLSSRQNRTSRPTYQPNVCVLEDRTVPALLRNLAPPVPPPAPVTTHFQVIAPPIVKAGQAFSVTVMAEDAGNHVVAGFKGTVQLKLTKADKGAALTASFTFSAADLGAHTFQVTLNANGTQTVSAVSGTLTGKAALTVTTVTHFGVQLLSQPIAGTATAVQVVALDANNNVVPTYVGTVHFTSSDVFAGLPSDYTFKPSDNGNHLFSATFSAGFHTLVVTDIARSQLQGGGDIEVFMLTNWFNPGGFTNWNLGWGNPWF